MAVSPSYVMGALDALARTGAVSPSYADGVRSVLEKKAVAQLLPVVLRAAPNVQRFVRSASNTARPADVSRLWRFLRDVAGFVRRHPIATGTAAVSAYGAQKLRDAGQYDRFNETLGDRNVERGGSNGDNGEPVDIRITSDDAADAFDAARPWHDNVISRIRNNTWDRWVRPFASAIPGNPKTWDQYKIDYENRVRADQQDYIRRANLERHAGGPLGQAAMGFIHGRHSDAYNDYVTGARSWMPKSQREAMGLPEKPVNMYQTPYTQSGLDGGLYKLPNDSGNKPADPPKGYGGLSEYGSGSSLFRSDSDTIRSRGR